MLSTVNFEKTPVFEYLKPKGGVIYLHVPRGEQRPRYPQGATGHPLRFSAVLGSLLVRSRFGVCSVFLRSFFGPIESEQTPNNDRRTTEQRAYT